MIRALSVQLRRVRLAVFVLVLLVAGWGLRAYVVAAQSAPPGYCADSQHDPTKWHPAVDPVTGCFYGHEHGDNPNPAGSPFAPLVFSGDEATPNENHHKHNGYKVFYIHRSNPNSRQPTSDPCDDVRVRIHMDVTPFERTGQYHSFEAAVAHCANGQMDVSYIQGWVDFGTVLRVSTREGGDPGIRPMKFAPSGSDYASNGLNIWEVWYGRSGVGLDMGWLMGEVPTLSHDGADPQNPATWNWTGGTGRVRKIENFNFYGWRETRRGEFWTDPFGRSVDPNSAACRDATVQCMRQYISPLFGRGSADQIIFNLQYNFTNDVTGVRFPDTFPAAGAHLPWGHSTQPTPTPVVAQPTPTPVVSQPSPTPVVSQPSPTPVVNPTEPSVRVDVAPASASPGEPVQVAVNVVNVTNLYGLQATCTVDPNVLVGTQASEGDVFTINDSIAVNKGFNPADGSWLVASSRRKPHPAFSGSGVAFKLNYTVQNAGSSPVNCEVIGSDANGNNLPLTVINASFNGAPPPPTVVPTTVPTELPPATEVPPTLPPPPTEPPAPDLATISGTLSYQNRPDNAGITVQLRDANHTVLAEVVTSANGAFSFTDVPVGAYSIRAGAPLHLSWVQPVTVETGGQIVDLGAYTLLAGDTNDDGLIDLTDAGLIGANFGLAVPPAPNNADLNGDVTVDIRDLALVGGNFDLTGPGSHD